MSNIQNEEGQFVPVNWNRIEDPVDDEVWKRVTKNFWLPEKVPLSNDIPSWRGLTENERLMVMRVFVGLTLLDTMQGVVGIPEMLEDAKTQHEEAVLLNFGFMERLCEGTELLTPEGWKPISKITANDEVMQYDPDTNEMSFTRPTKVYLPEWRDECYEIVANNGNARQVVSGGHRVYFEEKVRKANSCTDWRYSVAEARDLREININSQHVRFRVTGRGRSGAGMAAIDKIKVAIAADGSFAAGSGPRCTGAITGTVPCKFTFAKDRKIERLRTLVSEAGWGLRELTPSKDGRRNFVLDVPVEHAAGRTKRFTDWWSLDATSHEWAREFVAEIGLWDGHADKKGRGVTFYTTNKANSDFFVAVSCLAGYRPRTSIRVDDRSDNYNDTYVTYASFTKDTVGGQSMLIKEAPAQMTYCVQVPTTFLLTRNGEMPVISGNCVHAKSYSSIFSTLASTPEIDAAFAWSRTNPYLQKKAEIINRYYSGDDPLKRKISSSLLENFMFYSGFFMPLRYASHGQLTNTADIIRLIIRDESVHGYYIGHKFQQQLEERDRLSWDPTISFASYQTFAYDMLWELHENEIQYTYSLYADAHPEWVPEILEYLRFNGNRSMEFLGFEGIFEVDTEKLPKDILASLNPDTSETHDFFSGSGSSYVIGTVEEISDEDWEL